MNSYIVTILSCTLAFIIGFIICRRKKVKDAVAATKVIENLKATVEIYKITIEQLRTHETNVVTELKMDNYKLGEENKDLREEIKKLK